MISGRMTAMFRFLIRPWVNLLMPSFFGIGQGPSRQENQEFGALANIGNFATSTGEGDISTASDFWKGIVSGDQTALSKLLGPEFSAISQRGGQELKTLSEFGTRSGGTAAQQQQVGDEMRRASSELEGKALSTAVANLGTMGTGLLSTGTSAHEAAFTAAKDIQKQHAAKMNDIFKSIADVSGSIADAFTGSN